MNTQEDRRQRRYEERVERRQRDRKNRTGVWLVVGVAVLIVLLILWLTMADIWGDTDVAAYIAPLASALPVPAGPL